MGAFPYALAAIDIDDTLVGPDKKIGNQNRRAVETLRNLGCRIVLASGRRHENMVPFFDSLGLDDYLVSSHGARTEHPKSGQVLRRAPLAPKDTLALVSEGLDRGYTVMLWLTEGIFAQAESSWIDIYREETNGDLVTIADVRSLSDQPAEKVVWAATPAQIGKAKPDIEHRYAGRFTVAITNDWCVELTAKNAQKSDAVAAIAASAGIPQEAVLAFGDGNNDVSLLKWAGLGVAMPHGRESARLAARWIGRGGDPESALARAVEDIVNGVADLPYAKI